MKRIFAIALLVCAAFNSAYAQSHLSAANVLLRRYREGEKLTYHMKGTNERWHY
jgi:hypothetical protein